MFCTVFRAEFLLCTVFRVEFLFQFISEKYHVVVLCAKVKNMELLALMTKILLTCVTKILCRIVALVAVTNCDPRAN